MDKDYLVLKRASTSRSSGEWSDDDYDVLADGDVVGRIFKVRAAPVGTSWMWTLAFSHHEDRWPTHGYEPTREAAMAAFAKSWRRAALVHQQVRDTALQALHPKRLRKFRGSKLRKKAALLADRGKHICLR